MAERTTGAAGSGENWWRGAVIYQVYPRSFQDSNGDGIGDLGGVTRRLDHIARLGADAVWISPFYRSPMKDFGYDVTDYCDVDPMFGTLADFDALVARAHKLGLKVMVDLVLSHTSDAHAWFVESRSSRDNSRSDWYVWADAKPDGTPPNNWLSIFGGPAWQWDPTRQQYYFHNFLISQPDLNFHCPAVQDALLDVARFWLKRGVDGFRLDTINFYVHDCQLRDNPALPPERRNASIAPAVNPYNHQEHLYDKNQPENLVFLQRLRAVMDEFGATAAVGEVGDAQIGLKIVADYTSGGDKMHMCYGFDFLAPERPTGTKVERVLTDFDREAAEGWSCWAFSNHDVVRHASRWSIGDTALKVYAALLMSLRGSICLYQGEELGLTEAELAYEDLQDPYGKEFWPRFKGRDGCRTPMVWQADNRNGGFSDARPWLPVVPEHLRRAVSEQAGDPESMLSFYTTMLAFRRAHAALATGEHRIVAATDTVFAQIRESDGERIFCAFNLSDADQQVALPEGAHNQFGDLPFTAKVEGAVLHLPPWQAFFSAVG